jgi:ABC-type transport system involved in multi-copper enzyme maturation permease subunit
MEDAVSSERGRPSVRFEPLHPASRGRLIAGFVLGPVLWLVALMGAAWLFDYSWAIGIGLLVVVAAFLVSLVVLEILYLRRRSQERQYANSG